MYQDEQNSVGEPGSRAKRPTGLDHWRSAADLYRERRMLAWHNVPAATILPGQDAQAVCSPAGDRSDRPAHPPTHGREVGGCAGKDDNARRYLWTTTVVPRRKIASPSCG